jgi:hypothetical protein
VGGQFDTEQAPVWSAPITYTVGTTRKADCFATGRFLSFRVTSSTANAWRIKSFDMDVIERGPY